MLKNGLNKSERLSGKKIFEELFKSQMSLLVFPYKWIWAETPLSNTTIRFGVTAPKRNFKKAVTRNTLKRRTKESYRKNKHILIATLKKKNIPIALLAIYIAKEESTYAEIEKKMILSLQRIADCYEKKRKLFNNI